MNFEEHTMLIFNVGVPRFGLPAGTIGVVVHVYPDDQAYEIEFSSDDGATAGVK
jgi:hypothetical protein